LVEVETMDAAEMDRVIAETEADAALTAAVSTEQPA
jgi:hypothetical protein